MREVPRTIIWRGQPYHFERLKTAAAERSLEWAVWRRGEFIGTMPAVQETTKEFDARCIRWLADLLG